MTRSSQHLSGRLSTSLHVAPPILRTAIIWENVRRQVVHITLNPDYPLPARPRRDTHYPSCDPAIAHRRSTSSGPTGWNEPFAAAADACVASPAGPRRRPTGAVRSARSAAHRLPMTAGLAPSAASLRSLPSAGALLLSAGLPRALRHCVAMSQRGRHRYLHQHPPRPADHQHQHRHHMAANPANSPGRSPPAPRHRPHPSPGTGPSPTAPACSTASSSSRTTPSTTTPPQPAHATWTPAKGSYPLTLASRPPSTYAIGYDPALFDSATVERMAGHLQVLLTRDRRQPGAASRHHRTDHPSQEREQLLTHME